MTNKFASCGVHISWCNINFKCPICEYPYKDDNDKYLDRVNKNKSGYTKIKCLGCNRLFGMTYNMIGDAVSFELDNKG